MSRHLALAVAICATLAGCKNGDTRPDGATRLCPASNPKMALVRQRADIYVNVYARGERPPDCNGQHTWCASQVRGTNTFILHLPAATPDNRDWHIDEAWAHEFKHVFYGNYHSGAYRSCPDAMDTPVPGDASKPLAAIPSADG